MPMGTIMGLMDVLSGVDTQAERIIKRIVAWGNQPSDTTTVHDAELAGILRDAETYLSEPASKGTINDC